MASHIIDSSLFADKYGTQEMRGIFNDENQIAKWLEVEAALAQAEAKVGLIPSEAAEEISRKCKVEFLDFSKLGQMIQETSQVIVPVIWNLQDLCEGDAGKYLHWGATSQDILDTGFILQIKDALRIILRDLKKCEKQILSLAGRHKDTLMAGRTHGQQALPITFGFKLAVSAREIRRNIERLQDCSSRLLVGQLSGGVGTFASFGDKGPDVQRLVMEALGLQVPDISWQAARDRVGELGCVLALIANSFGRIANELFILQKTEFMEVEEQFSFGKIGSSTMPHKRNPRLCEGIISLAKLIQGSALSTLESMWIEHERDAKFMGIEWVTIPESLIMMSGLLEQAKRLFLSIEVKKENMLRNLKATKGLILSERVMLALGEKIGRQAAHEIVYRISIRAFEEHIEFKRALLEEQEIIEHFSPSELDEMLDPKEYVGLSSQIVDEILSMSSADGDNII